MSKEVGINKGVKFELRTVDERGVISKPRDSGDHTGFAKPGAIKGWARIERKTIVLFRNDQATDVPRNVKGYCEHRFLRRSRIGSICTAASTKRCI